MSDQPEHNPDRIIFQAAFLDYESDSRRLAELLGNMLKIVHGGEFDFRIGSAEPAFGWNFSTVSINKSMVRRLVEVPGNNILEMKGDSLDQKFVTWLNRQIENRKIGGIHVSLLSDLKSSRFGLF